jgi:hypothetical protein
MALVVVIAIAVLACGAAGVLVKFYESRVISQEAAAVFDGIAPTGSGESVLVKEGSIWRGAPKFFSEPFETVVFVFRDGRWVSFSTQHAEFIDCPVSMMVEAITKGGRKVADIAFCVHNHFSPIGFTPGDKDARYYLDRKNFRGIFGIYYPANDSFREMED